MLGFVEGIKLLVAGGGGVTLNHARCDVNDVLHSLQYVLDSIGGITQVGIFTLFALLDIPIYPL